MKGDTDHYTHTMPRMDRTLFPVVAFIIGLTHLPNAMEDMEDVAMCQEQSKPIFTSREVRVTYSPATYPPLIGSQKSWMLSFGQAWRASSSDSMKYRSVTGKQAGILVESIQSSSPRVSASQASSIAGEGSPTYCISSLPRSTI